MTHLGGHGQVGRDELCEIPLWHMTWQDCSCTGSVSEGQETSSIEELCFSHTFHTTSRQRKEELCCLAHLPMKHSASQPYISGTGGRKVVPERSCTDTLTLSAIARHPQCQVSTRKPRPLPRAAFAFSIPPHCTLQRGSSVPPHCTLHMGMHWQTKLIRLLHPPGKANYTWFHPTLSQPLALPPPSPKPPSMAGRAPCKRISCQCLPIHSRMRDTSSDTLGLPREAHFSHKEKHQVHHLSLHPPTFVCKSGRSSRYFFCQLTVTVGPAALTPPSRDEGEG